jgi:hypothetical protein
MCDLAVAYNFPMSYIEMMDRMLFSCCVINAGRHQYTPLEIDTCGACQGILRMLKAHKRRIENTQTSAIPLALFPLQQRKNASDSSATPRPSPLIIDNSTIMRTVTLATLLLATVSGARADFELDVFSGKSYTGTEKQYV